MRIIPLFFSISSFYFLDYFRQPIYYLFFSQDFLSLDCHVHEKIPFKFVFEIIFITFFISF